MTNFESQFSMSYNDYVNCFDIENWYRYYFIIKEVINIQPESILEIGAGNEVVKNCLMRSVKEYKVMDINPKLTPDILSDLRKFQPDLQGKFDCIICADVLEHLPLGDLEKSLSNISKYLKPNSKALITIPNREKRIAILNLFSHTKPLILTIPHWVRTPKGYYAQFIKKEKMIKDPHHCWEIGQGKITKENVEEIINQSGLRIEKSLKLLYVEFYELSN